MKQYSRAEGPHAETPVHAKFKRNRKEHTPQRLTFHLWFPLLSALRLSTCQSLHAQVCNDILQTWRTQNKNGDSKTRVVIDLWTKMGCKSVTLMQDTFFSKYAEHLL